MGSSMTVASDSHGWMYDRSFRAFEFDFSVRSDLQDAPEALDRLLGPFRTDGADGGGPVYALTRGTSGSKPPAEGAWYELFLDGDSIQRVANPGSMVDWLVADLSRRAIESTDRFVAVHAGVVSLDGLAAVLPAAPGAGKTTLTAGLTRAGFSFLSDEVAAIDPETARVHPFPRPILMDTTSMDVLDGLRDRLPPVYEGFRLQRFHLAPDDLRIGALGDPCRIGVIVAPAYGRGTETRLEPMGRAETLMHLANCTFNLDRFRGEGFEALARVASDCPGYRLAIGDLRSAISVVSDLLRP